MGQSLSLAAQPGGSAGIDVPELSDILYEKSLGTARLMKCVRARHQDGLVVVKLVMKPLATFELTEYVKKIRCEYVTVKTSYWISRLIRIAERDALADISNALGYQRVFETSTNGYLVRQYHYSSLYDRLSTRPFLEEIEKKWLAFQLLCALKESHARDLYHGDIKTENVLVTSWNWLYLTDYSASYKPPSLPEDNPANFSYYFDTSGRRTCYLAPERFLSTPDQDGGGKITWAMDVFSAGCVIAELFTESPIFSLSQLFKYRNKEYNPTYGYLDKIQDQDVREMVAHMIQVQPESRYSADEYLNFWRHKAFPEYFYSFLHQYMGLITDPSSGRSAVHPESSNFGEADDRIDKIYYEFDKIAYFLGYEDESEAKLDDIVGSCSGDDIVPIMIDLPNNRHRAGGRAQPSVNNGSLIFLTLIVSSLRHTARSSAKVRACELMLAFAEHVTDEAKLDRILPYLVVLLGDRSDSVKIAALRTMTQMLSIITTVSPVNAHAFTEYIRPRLQQFIGGPGLKASNLARATYASCLASLAESSVRILDMVQALHADGSIPTIDSDTEDGLATDLAYQNSFDSAKIDLLEYFETHTKALLTDKNASVRRALLRSVARLCVFFGSSRANDVILSHLNTYLNDKDWILKCAFFQTIVGVATFVGGPSLEEYIMPLMFQALTDPEEFVVQTVLTSFAAMAELGLFQKAKTWQMVEICARFMVHPNIWVREAAVHFVAASTRYISIADRQCIIIPLIRPFLKISLTRFTELDILDAIKKPISLSVFEMALLWATKTKNSLFWKPVQQQRTSFLATSGLDITAQSAKDSGKSILNAAQRNDEDEQWMKRLQEAGMTADDEFKIQALKEYLWRLAPKRIQPGKSIKPSVLEKLVLLKDLHVTPQTVFFETESKSKPRRHSDLGRRPMILRKRSEGPTHTIADALLDASTNIDDPRVRRKLSIADTRKGRTEGNQVAKELSKFDSPQSISRSPSTTGPKGFLPPKTNETHRVFQDHADAVQSEGTITPTDSVKARSILGKNDLRHKSSALKLLNRRDTFKANAETATNSANVAGMMEGPSQPQETSSNTPKTDVGHSYTGNDPTILRLLDSLALDNYPRDVIEFGPLVTPVSKRRSLKKIDLQGSERLWRPQGTLTATFGEHAAPINRVLPSPDHAFFITCSDDGTVKIWDTLRLERNIAHRSRHTFTHAEHTQVKAMCFIENTHTFVSAATDGSIKVVKIEFNIIGDNPRYGKPRVVRSHKLPKGEYAIWLEHTKTETSSLLLIATNMSKIIALDLRNMVELYTLFNPVHHGAPTCFCANHKQGWLVLGTSHGVLDLWDLRFHVRLKAWSLTGGVAINRVMIFPFDSTERKICVTGGTGQKDITIWDIEKGECCEVFRIGMSKGGGKDSLKPYEAWGVDDERLEGMLGRFATAIDPLKGESENYGIGIRTLSIGLDASDGAKHDSNSGFFFTGGADKKLRVWDCSSVGSSKIISGLGAEEPQPKYFTSHPTTGLTLHTERIIDDTGSKARRSSSKHPRSTVISTQQQALLRSHLDEITDVCLLELPVGMTVSVDRMGCIYIFQ
ncbi:uncharacterized protein KY384_007745 [Bacidia gigantensis]|uniref:uncharacterized protein n=1 Tax=Bacidia gigantensis TaxID=2732470 RepID=UPI001D05AED1|nr:uncharacterized protein KY384_007745 [Bacidia gigantensis]KAG8527592.1 hypothetical protein KY384_007745 [Bacidia gigantensis]